MAGVAGKSGGARPGSGRPRKREKYAGPIARAEKRIADRLPEIVDSQIALALGVKVQEFDEESGADVVYTKAPDRQAGQYLLDRIMGKPTERKEHSGPDGEAIEIRGLTTEQALQALREEDGQEPADDGDPEDTRGAEGL